MEITGFTRTPPGVRGQAGRHRELICFPAILPLLSPPFSEPSMRRTLVILCFLAGFALSPVSIYAQGIDPAQEAFVNAFLAVRKAEEQVAAGDLKSAIKTYRGAADTLSKIKQQWPNW